MQKKNILLKKDVVCPVCKEKSPYVFANPRLYVAANRESDMHVLSYRWAEDVVTDVMPHHFAVWQCRSCMFADLSDYISTPKDSSKEEALHDTYGDLGINKKLVLASLRKLVTKVPYDFESALALHLAALYISCLPDEEEWDNNKIGRISLRIAWLYREKFGGKSGKAVGSGIISGLVMETEKLAKNLRVFKQGVNEVANLSETRTKALADGEENAYKSVLDSISDKADEMQTLLDMLHRVILSDESGGKVESVAGATSDAQINQTLLSLKSKWPTMPADEDQAIRRAITAFDHSYKYETTYQSIEQSMSVVSLIVELYTRINEEEKALEYIAEIYKSGMNNKLDLERRLKKGRQAKTLTNHDERMLNRKIGNINVTLREAGETRRKLIDKIIAKNRPAIDKVLADNVEEGAAAQINALKEAGFVDDIIMVLKHQNAIVEEKKRGLKRLIN